MSLVPVHPFCGKRLLIHLLFQGVIPTCSLLATNMVKFFSRFLHQIVLFSMQVEKNSDKICKASLLKFCKLRQNLGSILAMAIMVNWGAQDYSIMFNCVRIHLGRSVSDLTTEVNTLNKKKVTEA